MNILSTGFEKEIDDERFIFIDQSHSAISLHISTQPSQPFHQPSLVSHIYYLFLSSNRSQDRFEECVSKIKPFLRNCGFKVRWEGERDG